MQKPSLKELHFCHSRHFLPFLIPRNKFAVPGEMSAGEFKYLVLHLVDFSHRLKFEPTSPKGPSDAEVQKEIKKATPEDGPGGSGWSKNNGRLCEVCMLSTVSTVWLLFFPFHV